jgi:hypothetical protein
MPTRFSSQPSLLSVPSGRVERHAPPRSLSRFVQTVLLTAALALSAASLASSEAPYPTCALPACDPTCARGDASCTGPDDYADYLFLAPGTLPNDYQFDPESPGDGSGYLFEGTPATGPAAGVRVGHDVVGGWQITTGRPDVVSAVLDSGIRWSARELALKVALNTGELPLPAGCDPSYDCDGNGAVNVLDWDGAACGPALANTVSDANGNQNGFLDGQDLILLCSDGVDDDGNGHVDDIAGWDFQQDDNDPSDDVDYGHGTGQGGDMVAEANDGSGQPGVAPAAMFVPLKVADSFVAVGTDFAQALVYAVDLGVSLVSEALGTISADLSGQAAIDYAYRRGVAVIASAADEQSQHHNFPAAFEHTVWVNSVRPADGELIAVEDPPDFTLQNGCTNHGGHAWVAIGSKSCSSEATGRAAGLALLLLSHGRNLMDRGELEPYPGLASPFSAEEVRQILRQSALDIDHSDDPILPLTAIGNVFLTGFLSAPALGLVVDARHFDTRSGWDQFTGYGRPDTVAMLQITSETIPPEADLSGSLRWFDVIDPDATPSVPVVGSAAARRVPGAFTWTLAVGCGVQPDVFDELATGMSMSPLVAEALHDWSAADTAAECGFDPAGTIEEPDAHAITLRLRVLDANGRLGEDRRTVAIHRDASLAFPPVSLGGSGEASATLADVDGDRILDIVIGSASGALHVLRGSDGQPLPGFPVLTDPLPVHPSPAWGGEVPLPHESILGAAAVDDLDGDGTPEIVVASVEGSVYVFEHDGSRRTGFPVHTDPALSAPSLRDRWNDLDPGISGAPTLADLDAAGPPALSPASQTPPELEIVVGAWDGHIYAWRDDASAVDGFPVKLADRSRVDVDPATGKVTPASAGVLSRPAKIVSSPAVGDLDGDGHIEIVATTNEEYEEGAQTFDADSNLWETLETAINADLFDGVELRVASRIYVLNGDGSFADEIGGEPSLWPAAVPMLVEGLLPSVATGTPGSPALADIDGDGDLEVAIFGAVGPAMLFDHRGEHVLPDFGGLPRPLAIDFPGIAPPATVPGFPAVPATTGSADAPFFGALGSGAFGDLDGAPDGLPEYAAPTAGLRVLFDTLVPGSQEFSDHQLAAWNPRDGSLLPAFPRVMDDMQFLTSPSLADVSGDGIAEVLNGSGVHLVRAFAADGSAPEGFPKFTHGWLIATPAVGDVDGDGLNELIVATREGRLFVWNTQGLSSEEAIPWQSAGRDRRNTQNLDSGIPTTVPEPGAPALQLAALLLLAALARKRAR